MLHEPRRRRQGPRRPSTMMLAGATAAVIALTGCNNEDATAPHANDTTSTTATTPNASATPTPSATSTCPGRQGKPLTIRDQPNDVKHLNSDGYPITPERPHPKTDLLSVDVTNGCPDVRIVEHIADLQPGGYQEVDLGILTPQRKRSYHGWGVLPDTRVEQVAPFPMYWSASNRYSDLPWSCPDRSAQADFARDAVTFVVPISCLGQPTWVSIRAVNTDGDPNYDDYEDTLEPPAVGPDGWSPRAHR